ncbi:hypothetical protein VTN02DRAFT_2411 [Thermoascus thermophilus]
MMPNYTRFTGTLATPERLPYQAMRTFAPGSYPDRISHGWTVEGQKATPHSHICGVRQKRLMRDQRCTRSNPPRLSSAPAHVRSPGSMLDGEIIRGTAAFPTPGPLMGDATPDFCDPLSGRHLPPHASCLPGLSIDDQRPYYHVRFSVTPPCPSHLACRLCYHDLGWLRLGSVTYHSVWVTLHPLPISRVQKVMHQATRNMER